MHFVPKKRGGGNKATTITDARERHLLPSVTTYLKCLAAPRNLVRWSYRQIAMAALTYPKKGDEVLDDSFLDKIIEDAFVQTQDAADLGGEVHKALEMFFSDQPHDPKLDVFVRAVDEWAHAEGVHVMQRELTLVNSRDGYAGRTDAIIDSHRGVGIMDFKCRKSSPKYDMTPWEDNMVQIAAYYKAQFGDIDDKASGVNLLISYTEPGRVQATWYDAPELRKGWDLFQAIMSVWRLEHSYDPRTP